MVREEQVQEMLTDMGLYDLDYAPLWLEEMINQLLDAGWTKEGGWKGEADD